MGGQALSEGNGMTGKEELLASFDDVLSNKWDSIESILKGISEEEVLYQNPVYSKEEREVGHPLSGTILWHIVHLADCYQWYKGKIISRPEKPVQLPPPEVQNLAEGITNLKLHRTELRDCISSLSEDQLGEKLYDGKTVSDLARASVRHDAWHGGQIAVARRLYRMRDV